MKHVAAVLLLALANKEINEKNINEILASVGIKSNPQVVKSLLNAVKGKTAQQLIAEGLPKLAATVSAGPVAGSTAAVEKKEEPKKKEEKKKAPEPEPEEEGGLGFLF